MLNFYSYLFLILLEFFKVYKLYNLNLIGKEEVFCFCKFIYMSWEKNIDI